MSALACANGRNSRFSSAGSMPMPLSVTAKVSRVRPASRARPHDDREHDAAAIGELHRVVDQIFQRAAKPHRVADDAGAARRPRDLGRDLETFAFGARRQQARNRTRQIARRKDLGARAPARSIRPWRHRPRAWSAGRDGRRPLECASAQRCSRSGRSDACSSSASARMPVSGVRISCASEASATSVAELRRRADVLRRLAGFPFRRLLALWSSAMSPPAPGGPTSHATAD